MSDSNISFCSQVKKELYKTKPSVSDEKIAETCGFVFSMKDFSEETLVASEDSDMLNLVAMLLSEVVQVNVAVSERFSKKGNKKALHLLNVPSMSDRKKIMDFLTENLGQYSVTEICHWKNKNCLAAFCRGVFLICANVANPNREYRIDFSLSNKDNAQILKNLLSHIKNIDLKPSIIERNGSFIVYFKGNEKVADFLTYIGAPLAAMELIQVKMLKEIRNYVNRTTNFETANINKMASAAATQIEKIELISKEKGLDWLPDKLQELARLRLENPDMSLKELGEALHVPISRSGVNHRLSKIMKLSDEIKLGGK